MSKVLVVSLVFVAALSTSVFAQKGRERFDPNGTFWIIGAPPSGFSDFSAINLNAPACPVASFARGSTK